MGSGEVRLPPVSGAPPNGLNSGKKASAASSDQVLNCHECTVLLEGFFCVIDGVMTGSALLKLLRSTQA